MTDARPSRRHSDPTACERDPIVDAFMALLAEKPFEDIGFAEIARRAGVSLAELRGKIASKIEILAAHMREIDRAVLAGIDADMAEEPPRERLFDVLMRRLDALAPHKEAVRSLQRSALRNPGLAFALNGLAVRSQQWMLTAADISRAGPEGHGARAGPGAAVRLGAAHLGRRRRSRPCPHAGGARPRAVRAASAGPACSTICCADSGSGLPHRAPRRRRGAARRRPRRRA